jgi:hypothetical protein
MPSSLVEISTSADHSAAGRGCLPFPQDEIGDLVLREFFDDAAEVATIHVPLAYCAAGRAERDDPLVRPGRRPRTSVCEPAVADFGGHSDSVSARVVLP